MTDKNANGQRFLALSGGTLTLPEIALLIKEKMGIKNIVTRVAPNWLIRLIALFNPAVRNIVPQLGRRKNASNQKARSILNWKPKSNEEAVTSAITSMLQFGVIKK
jgi:dihydroflavonol-4-reductase